MFWFLLFIVMLIIEAVTVNLVTIWFAIGALVSCIVSYFCNDILIQTGVFIAVSTLSLILTRPLISKFRNNKKVATNLDRVIGMKGVVTSDILNNSVGEVKVDGKKWSAISDCELRTNDVVKIIKIDGVKLIVKKED